MSTRTNNAIKNISYNIGYQLLMLVLGFVNRTIFLYFLNVEYLGIQAVFKDILTLLSMADLGLITAMTYSFYKPLAEKNETYISGLVHFYKKVCNVIALVIFLGGLGLIPFLKYVVNLKTDLPHLTLYYLLYLLNTVASYIVVYKTTVLVADQKGYITAKYGSIFNILQNVVLCLFLWLTHNFLIYLIIQVFFTYIYNFVVSAIASKEYPYINEKVSLAKDDIRGLFDNIKAVFVYKTSNVLINATDSTLISIIVGTTVVGFYSNYMLVVSKAISLLTTVFNSLTASLGNLIVEEGKAKRYEVFQILQTICSGLSVIVVTLMFFLLQDFIRLWLGKAYLLDTLVLYAIIINLYFSVILLPVWVYREATGLYKQIKYVMLGTAGANLLLSIILGHFIGLPGILFGTVLAKLLTYIWYEPILLFKQFFGHSSRSYFLELLKNIALILVLFLLGSLLSRFLFVTGYLSFICKAFLLLVLSVSCVYIFYRKSTGLRFVKAKFGL